MTRSCLLKSSAITQHTILKLEFMLTEPQPLLHEWVQGGQVPLVMGDWNHDINI